MKVSYVIKALQMLEVTFGDKDILAEYWCEDCQDMHEGNGLQFAVVDGKIKMMVKRLGDDFKEVEPFEHANLAELAEPETVVAPKTMHTQEEIKAYLHWSSTVLGRVCTSLDLIAFDSYASLYLLRIKEAFMAGRKSVSAK